MGLHLFECRVQIAVFDVILDSIVEEDCVLWDHADQFAEGALGDGCNILAINHDPATGDIIEPEKQAGDCCLACAGVAWQNVCQRCFHRQSQSNANKCHTIL